MKRSIQLLGFVLLGNICYGQMSLSKDTIDRILTHSPAFSIYKDNYFIGGTTLGETPSKDNSDLKFQFSFKQRILNKPFGKGVFTYLTYTQKSFWNIFQDSSPFGETNYNPGLLFVMPSYKANRLTGIWTSSLEHESNGRDSTYSRSWNFVSVAYGHFFSPRLTASVKAWIPFSLSDNPDLMEYIGYGEGQLQWTVKEDRVFFNLLVRKGASWDWKGSIQSTITYRPFENRTLNLMLQWWQGYAESLIDYQEARGMLRFGLQIKPTYSRFY